MVEHVSINGAVDMHSHVGPSLFERRVDGYEFAKQCAEAEMDAVVMKEHYLPTVYAVPFIERLLANAEEEIEVIGSVVLNYCNGGFNPFMVQTAIEYGAGVIWAPTIDAKNHGDKTAGVGKFLGVEEVPEEYENVTGLTPLEDGELTRDARLCIKKIVDADIVLAIGHLSFPETKAMVEYATEIGNAKIMIDHPLFEITGFSLTEMETLVSMGAYLNFPYCGLGPQFRWTSPEEIYEHIDHIGIDHCLVSSDVGQLGNPSAPDALTIMGELLYSQGLSADDFRTLVERNPKKLLDL